MLRQHIVGRGHDLADDRALSSGGCALDEQADRPVRVEVSGPGVLAGFGSANPSTEERFDASERLTYDGRPLAVLRPTGPGKIRLTASAAGCEPAEIVVTAE